jgi:hypothetical protein
LALIGCAPGPVDDGAGPDPDARLISKIETFGCRDGSYHFLGVRNQAVSLEVAPDALEPLDLPAAGTCVTGLDLFPTDAGPGAGNPSELASEVVWIASQSSGTIKRRSEGFWASFGTESELTCIGSTQVGGVELEDAGAYAGVGTPFPPSDGNVLPDPNADDGIEFGEEIVVDFEAPGWDQVWIQLRRERNTEAWETLTCNVTGDAMFTLGAEHWSEMNETLSVDTTDLLVVFEKSRSEALENGQTMQTVTRTVTNVFDL